MWQTCAERLKRSEAAQQRTPHGVMLREVSVPHGGDSGTGSSSPSRMN